MNPPTDGQLGRLAMMTAADQDPTLTHDDLVAVLAPHAQSDASERVPTHDEWEPTWAMGAAAQDGWLVKAGKAAHRVTGSDGSVSLTRSDLHAHCMRMAEAYGRRRLGTVVLAGTRGPAQLDLLPVFNSDLVGVPGDPAWPGATP